MNLGRPVSAGASLARWLCTTALEAAEEFAAAAMPRPQIGREVRLHRRLSALGVTGETVAQTLNEYIREGKVIKKYELERSIKELRGYGRYRQALEIFEWMDVRNTNFSYRDYAIRLDLIAKAQGIAAAENYFNDLKPPMKNQLTYGALLHGYCYGKMEDKALSLYKKMGEMGIAYTCLNFNNLMSLYMKLDLPQKVPPLIKEMREKNILLDAMSYNILMHSYACLDDIKAVERVFEQMKKENFKYCDWTTYSNLAVLYVKAGLHDKAESALKRLEEEMGSHNRLAYHYLISSYANISNQGEVHRIWNSLKAGFPITTNRSYHVILQAVDKLNDLDGISRLYLEWESNCASYDVRIANVTIRAFLKRDMIREAESVIHKAFKRSNGPFFTAWELFIEFFLRKQKMGAALKCLEAAISVVKDNEWTPNPEYVENLLEYFEEEKDVNSVEELCKMMKRINCLNSRVYLSLLRTYIAAGKSVADMRKRMEDGSIEMDNELENLLQRVCPK